MGSSHNVCVIVEVGMWKVVLLEEVDAWFLELVRGSDPVAEHVHAAIG
jgi:hypothetical protein